jgi:UDP-glucose 4-epimerase
MEKPASLLHGQLPAIVAHPFPSLLLPMRLRSRLDTDSTSIYEGRLLSILIIGGCGFIGLNVAERLAASGRSVMLFDRDTPPAKAQARFDVLPGDVSFLAGDVLDPASLDAALLPGLDCVIYGAAITAGPQREADDPERIVAVNLGGMVSALTKAHERGTRRFINLSSATAYGAAGMRHDLLIEGETPEDPRALYPITKFASERIASRLGELWGMDVRNVRLSAVFGPWERATAVRDTLSPQFQVLQALLAGDTSILPREGVRDWLYAPDAAVAIETLIDAPLLSHDLYNIGPGERWSVLDWGRTLAAAMGLPENHCRLAEQGEAATIDLHAPGDRASMSIDRLRDAGFAPAYDMASSARHLAEWQREHGDAS